ncbi:hypothetical protein F2Q68_00006425 [Brassica cretica]|uniref:DUF4283 domain-containing protein n=1 Tax=Brassica cretica TaxID=69181 RepID=A0A8S9JJV5_BRACR|nr:hypothetical protein F2Q68_00006425 [Brassica cretica]
MGSSYMQRSSHLADIKRKGIFYEDDDSPIKLTDQDDTLLANEFSLSLIGKILNPKIQNVDKILQKMPSQRGMEDRITANDLGNGNFLLNFSSEDDLNSVLRQFPFHFNFCMFVLVRWKPIVHDDYPWIIPFKVQVIGIPLHLWTDKNLRNIGARLGHVHVDTLEVSEGRMLVDVDTRRPLKFSRKFKAKDGMRNNVPPWTYGFDSNHKQSVLVSSRGCNFHRNIHRVRICIEITRQMRFPDSLWCHAWTYLPETQLVQGMVWRTGSMRRGNLILVSSVAHIQTGSFDVNDHSRSNIYGGSRASKGPYDRHQELTCAKRLASTIVTPSRVDHDMDENVTKRTKGLTRSLSFTTLSDQEPVIVAGDNQIISALNDMEIEDQQDDGMMECEMPDEDLLGLDLKEMEDTTAQHDSIIVTA